MAVALRAHRPLPDRRRSLPPGSGRVGVVAEDGDLRRLEPAVAQRRVRGEPAEPGADDRSARCHGLLYRAGEQALDEVALEGEEDRQRHARATRTTAGAISSMFEPNWRSCEKIATVIGCVSRPNVSATSRSFHVQRNWKIASEAIAGRPSGRIRRTKIANLRRAVDPRRLEQVLRDPDEEVPQAGRSRTAARTRCGTGSGRATVSKRPTLL